MMTLSSTNFFKTALGYSLLFGATLMVSGRAVAQDALPPPAPVPGEAAPAAEPAPPPMPGEMTAAPRTAMPMSPTVGSVTDHDTVVGHWGIEARHMARVQKTPGQDGGCGMNCPVDLNAIGVRRWSTHKYAWSAGLIFGAGGGASKKPSGESRTWDTYFGFGPTVASHMLLANWKHLAVSASPQLDLVYFAPSGRGSKTLLVNVRGVIEGEIHLGMMGLPAASVGIMSGLLLSYKGLSKADKMDLNPTGTSSEWSVGLAGPQSLWGLVTNMYLRFYF